MIHSLVRLPWPGSVTVIVPLGVLLAAGCARHIPRPADVDAEPPLAGDVQPAPLRDAAFLPPADAPRPVDLAPVPVDLTPVPVDVPSTPGDRPGDPPPVPDASGDPAPPEAACPAPRMSCAGACLDVRSDPAHCGSCARACPMGACVDGQCACQDGVRNGAESDVDCAGGCAPCAAGKRCTLTKDCAAGLACLSGRCWPGAGAGANSGLVAWYDLEQAPPNVLDGSGNGNNGTVAGATQAPGKVGNGYRFAAGTCIRAPDSASLGMAGATGLTIIAWANYTGGCAPGFVRATLVLKENSYGIALVCANQTVQSGVGTTTSAFNLAGTKPVMTNAWQLLAVTWDGAMAHRYVNAVEVETEAIAGTMTRQATGLGIGCRQVTASGDNGTGASFIGVLDEVAIYSRAWTPKEIQDYYMATR